MALTEQELLLLDNVMYLKDSTKDYNTLGDLVNDCLASPEMLNAGTLSGGYETEEGIENFKDILNEISQDDKLMNLGMGQASNEATDNLVRARCFIEYDEAGNEIGQTVAFRGTGGYVAAWRDNFEGLYMEETTAQKIAREYIEDLGYDDITVTGHSKGGNLAMYVTAQCGAQIQSCVSFDGQGFGSNCLQSMSSEQIDEASEKIKSVSACNDFVNILLTPIAGTNLYFENEEGGANAHSAYYLYTSNEEMLEENGGVFVEEASVEQDDLMNIAHNASEELVNALPEDEKIVVADVLGVVVADVMSKDVDSADSKENITETLGEYASKKIDSWNDAIQDVTSDAKEVVEEAEQFGKVVIQKGADGAMNIINGVQEAVEGVGNFGKLIIQKGADGAMNIVNGVQEVAEEAGSFGKLIIQKGADGAMNIINDAQDVGDDIISGMQDMREKGIKEISKFYER